MNFVDYCIENKNYSALKAIRDYSEVRTFSKLSKKQKAALVAVPAVVGAGVLATDNMEELGKAKKSATDFIEEKLKPIKEKYQELDDKYGREFRKGSEEETLRDRYLDLKDKIKSIGKSSDEDNDSDDDDSNDEE